MLQKIIANEERLGKLSHDLGGRLSNITGYASILGDGLTGALTPQQQAFVDKIVANAEDMQVMLLELLSLVKP